MSSGLMASAQMRMKQKREKASQSKVTSPSSIASPSSAGAASPSNMNGFGSNSNSGSKKHSMMNTASASQGVSQTDFMPPEHTTYASPPQYNANNNNNTSNRYQQQNNSYNASPLASSPNRPMRKEEQFDTAIQHRGNYTHHLKARNTPSPSKPRRGYDSYTDAPKEEQERLNQQYYQQQAPPPPPPSQRQQQQGFAPSSRNVQPNNHSRNERMNPYYQDSQDETMMDGGEYEYDITEDEEEYVNERNDRVTVAPTMPQGRTPVYSQPVAEDENETISSEIALNGNPTTKKKKERKNKKAVVSSLSKDARYGIHNVGSDDAMDKPAIVSDARYGIHHTTSKDNGVDDGDNNEHGRASPERQYNYGDIAAHAGRYAAAAAASETIDPLAPPKPNRATTNPFDDDSFGSKGGQEDGGDEGNQNEHFVSADSESNNGQQNMWDDDISSTMQKFDRNSKSWDQENKNSFEQNLWAGSFFGESGSASKQSNEEQPPDAAVAAQEAPKDKELDSVMDKKYPWKDIKEYAEQTEADTPLSDAESDDDDTLFVFDKKKQKATPNVEPPTNPNETFNKISQGIQQADEARNAAQTLQRARSGGSTEESSAFLPDESKFGNQGPTSPSRSVAFVGEAGNKVHTYHVQQHSRDHSGSDSGTYETRDDEDDETDGETLDDGDTLDNYTLDDATYGDATYGESTIGGTTLDTRGKEEVENETNIMDHVDSAVKAIGSALGGIMLFANNAANSLSTENDDTVQGTSTVGQESEQTGDKTSATTATTSEYDWIGYMEKFLFPESDDQEGSATQDGSTHVSTMRSTTASTEEEEDSDGYLLQQALASARAIHHIHGIQFDEMQEINVLTDVKFVVVTVELPLGLLFQEHELGAWVSRVVPDGNGARKEVQPGDQLAAINGKSSAHATIDEVASIISATPKNEGVELTFLRYVGPLRPVPGAVIQEGFEVTDKNVSKKPKKGIFGKKKANQATGNKASLDFAPNKRRNKNLSISMTQEKTKTGLTPPRPQKGKTSLKLMFNRGKKKS